MLTLEQLCQRLLLRYKAYIGDIGDLPIEVLHPVLQKCDADDLLRIEDDTRANGRELEPTQLDIYWKQVYIEDFAGGQEARAAEYAGCKTPHFDSWKRAYRERYEALEAKKARVGKQLREAWKEEEKRKQARTLKVIDKTPSSTKRGVSRVSPASNGSRMRLARKLHILAPRTANKRAVITSTVKGSVPKKMPQLLERDIDWDVSKFAIATSSVAVAKRPLGVSTQATDGDQGLIAACNAAKLVEVEVDWG